MWSERVHGSCLRYPSDLPSCGRPVVALRVRRFICPQGACPRRTFVEQADGLTRWNGQVTERQRASVAGPGRWPHAFLSVVERLSSGRARPEASPGVHSE
ncbi:hypothetical protein ACH4A8_05300 [Streptomyces vietnamensis]|uniref:hypothetical protein n=1 Tax=Streptomyces vietnamensis TaxID=362257 RepID=UPI0037ADE395